MKFTCSRTKFDVMLIKHLYNSILLEFPCVSRSETLPSNLLLEHAQKISVKDN